MAYTLSYSLGTITVIDTTLNNQTSLNLPGRNYAGYGQPVDQGLLSLLENFAGPSAPVNSIPGQQWFDTSVGKLKLNTSSNVTPGWSTIISSESGGGLINLTVDNLTVTDTLTASNIVATNGVFTNVSGNGSALTDLNASNITTGTLDQSRLANSAITINGTTVALGGTATITAVAAAGTLTGTTLNSTIVNSSLTSVGTLTSLTVSGTTTSGTVRTPILTTGAAATAGTITGTWTLSAGSKLNATYADLAERYEADDVYESGTVVEIGGTKEITAVKSDLSDRVFGVVSDTAGYLMNAEAGTDKTHPSIAMTGRVKVNIIGSINKGDRLVSTGFGYARAATEKDILTAFNVIGRALETKSTSEPGKVLAVVSARI